jgi:hypothetical protein
MGTCGYCGANIVQKSKENAERRRHVPRAARSADVLGFGAAVGTSAVGGCFRWVLAHSIGAGRPVLARSPQAARAAPKTTTKRWTRLKAVWTIGFRSPRRLELLRRSRRPPEPIQRTYAQFVNGIYGRLP